MMVNWTVSPGLYSPVRLVSEPFVPILTPLTAVMISFSRMPAFSAGLPVATAE